MVKIKVFTFNTFSENTIILWDEESNETAIIDPGTSSTDEENELSNFISSKNLNIKYLNYGQTILFSYTLLIEFP